MSPRTTDLLEDEHPRAEPVLHSLAEFSELIVGCCELVDAHTVVEIGCEWGYLTSALADWMAERRGKIYCIEPYPSAEFRDVVGQHHAAQLIEATSPGALAETPPGDVYLVDGDHNFWTVSEELERIDAGSRARGHLPLILLHDVGWPWGRRDIYYSPRELPDDAVRPYTFDLGVVPERSDVVEGGFRSGGTYAIALEEGGPRNGVLAAVEEFIAVKTDYELIVIPSVFGVAVLVPRGEHWSPAVTTLVRRWGDHPLLVRLETNRVEMFIRLLELLDELAQAGAASSAHNVALQDAQLQLQQRDAEIAAMRSDADSLARSRWVSRARVSGITGAAGTPRLGDGAAASAFARSDRGLTHPGHHRLSATANPAQRRSEATVAEDRGDPRRGCHGSRLAGRGDRALRRAALGCLARGPLAEAIEHLAEP